MSKIEIIINIVKVKMIIQIRRYEKGISKYSSKSINFNSVCLNLYISYHIV